MQYIPKKTKTRDKTCISLQNAQVCKGVFF